MNKLSQTEGNNWISNRIKNAVPSAIGKIGNVEGECLLIYDRYSPVPWGNFGQAAMLYINAGVYPFNGDVFDSYCNQTLKLLPNFDMLVAWNGFDGELISKYGKVGITTTELRALEPFYHESPWSLELKDKNVLLISPFTETAKLQYANRKEVWSKKEVLPDFNLLTIKSPYSSGVDPNTPFKSWFEAYDHMQNLMSNMSFDVAIVGAGAYSLWLVNHAKSLGKIGIHIGGGTQILFGIKGRRWDAHDNISKFFNDSWRRPSAEETPINPNLIGDGATYW
jgi:hypothetical protein